MPGHTEFEEEVLLCYWWISSYVIKYYLRVTSGFVEASMSPIICTDNSEDPDVCAEFCF